MSAEPSKIEYRGYGIVIDVREDTDGTVGYADIFKGGDFKGRVAVGSAAGSADGLRNKLRCLAKAKADVWAFTSDLSSICARPTGEKRARS